MHGFPEDLWPPDQIFYLSQQYRIRPLQSDRNELDPKARVTSTAKYGKT